MGMVWDGDSGVVPYHGMVWDIALRSHTIAGMAWVLNGISHGMGYPISFQPLYNNISHIVIYIYIQGLNPFYSSNNLLLFFLI